MARRRITIVDILRRMQERLAKPEWREDEVLDELLDTVAVLGLEESTVQTPTQTYRWGPYSDGDSEMRWQFFTWG